MKFSNHLGIWNTGRSPQLFQSVLARHQDQHIQGGKAKLTEHCGKPPPAAPPGQDTCLGVQAHRGELTVCPDSHAPAITPKCMQWKNEILFLNGTKGFSFHFTPGLLWLDSAFQRTTKTPTCKPELHRSSVLQSGWLHYKAARFPQRLATALPVPVGSQLPQTDTSVH